MNTRNGSGAISDYENIFIKFLSSLWESQAPILMGYAGCVIAFVAPMVGIIYYQTKAFQNISISLFMENANQSSSPMKMTNIWRAKL